ncbi:RNA-directed DNA polymerase [Salmonella enterica]|nr:RNA-directed DNA polymerase [Salmonella enterica]EED9772225.1 RNA-directed DNA polymerase [Salmonella enterica subsp. enterica serovar Mississippi]EAQ1701465.1 RNA-directed DNA polymerase [Salmonella enterica]EAS3432664.1 RNA-directed DNA polymerase [Salmonella enterica]EAT7532066.1 RNA-directed DNA polymerase [Salmonella enterica]
MKKVHELTSKAALSYFLRHDSYTTLELPSYIDFSTLLENINSAIDNDEISYSPDPKSLMGKEINYEVLVSKDGLYSWRRITLINPLYYVYFCRQITNPKNWKRIKEKFKSFESNDIFLCSSIPVRKGNTSNVAASVMNWWEDFEQKSLALALEYEFMFSTDISNFYPSIYTHSFEWVFISKEEAKKKENNDNPGRLIDSHIQMMMSNQTNGIPLGSTLMDTFAELILGEIDIQLKKETDKHNIVDYRVVRYRDDYRIFSNSKDDLDRISKCLVSVLGEFGLDLNSKKTELYEDIVLHSLKSAKKDYIKEERINSLQKMLYVIYLFSLKHPNSKITVRYLNDFLSRLFKRNKISNSGHQLEAMLGIISSIMAKNPTTYPVGTAVFSKLLSFLYADDTPPKFTKLEQLHDKLGKQPNTEMLDIWFQRVQGKINLNWNGSYKSALCIRINDELKKKKAFSIDGLWDVDWIPGKPTNKNKAKILSLLKKTKIVDTDAFEEMDNDITPEEVNLFDKEHSA